MQEFIEEVREALAGRYRIERELGQGGTATVYLAHDLKHDREVAIKVLRREVAAVVGTSRFLREIDIAAKLTHPHILALHDSGEIGGLLYFVMPYVADGSLRERLRDGTPVSIDDTIRVLHDIADALDYAHGRGVVHRDIKPANVLLSGRHHLVADFGIAKALFDATDVTNPTDAAPIGTPAYMAPEQVMADPLIDHRADIYALGLVGYEMLTGAPPFRADDPRVLLRLQVTKNPAPIASKRRGVPRALARVVERCLAKNPDDRWPTAGAFLRELEKARKPSRLVPALVGAVLGAVALAVLGVAVSRGESGLVPRRVVVSSLENRTGDSTLDDVGSFAAHWITQGLQRTETVDVVPTPTALQSLRHVNSEIEAGRVTDPVRALAEETGAGTVISGAIHEDGGRLQYQVQITDARRGRVIASVTETAELSEASSIAIDRLRDRVTGALSVNFDERITVTNGARAMPTLEAYRAFERGLDAYTRLAYREAVQHLLQALAIDSTFPLPLLYASVSYLNVGLWAGADSLVEHLSDYRDELSQYDRRWLEYLQARLAGDDERALEAMRAASAMAPASKASYNRALMALRTRRPREALESLELLDPDRGPMRGWLPYWNQKTWALHQLGDLDGELEAAQLARERHPGRLRVLQLETDALASLGRWEAVDSLLDVAVTMPPDNRTVGVITLSAGREAFEHGFPAQADSLFARAVSWYERQHDWMTTVAVRHQYGIALYNAGRLEDAERTYRDIVADAPAHLGAHLYRGLIAAERQEFDTARAMSRWFAEHEPLPYSFGLLTWNRARIALAMGEIDRAAAIYTQSALEGRGVRRFRPYTDREFVPHRDNPALEILFRPRG